MRKCPACQNPIARSELKVAKEFNCPHCGKLVRSSRLFRTFLYLACYAAPTIVVARLGATLLEKVVLWLILAFVFGVLFILGAVTTSSPRLELVRKKDDEVQTLGLRK
jgi:predicted RNA-binding Zn-ribbon protein involved in translation (DUF1610 family)